MSEQQIFVTLGFSEKTSCTKAYDILLNLIANSSDYETIFPEVTESEIFVDMLKDCNNFGTVLTAEWFGGTHLDQDSITDNLKKLNPKYLTIVHYYDSGQSCKSGYIDNKKTKYQSVMDALADESDEIGYTMALLSENTKKVKSYLDKGVDPHSSFFKDKVLLHQDYGFKGPLVLALIEAGTNVNVQSLKINECKTPLHLAVKARRYNIVKALINAGADVNASSVVEKETLIFGALYPEPKARKILKILLDAGANVDAADDEGYTPLLRLLSKYSDESVLPSVKLLIKYGAGINYSHENTGNALFLAKQNDHIKCIEFFTDKGMEVIEPAPRKPVPLPKDDEFDAKMYFIEEHESKSNQYANEFATTGSYWTKDKEWLSERKEIWKYIEISIKHWLN